MSAKQYRPWELDQLYLLPPSPREWLPEGHLAYFILEVVETLDLGEIERGIQAKDARGERPYSPRMMVALLLYAYCVGVYSSRKIARETYEDVAFRALCGEAHPHFTTINQFRLEHRAAFLALFLQVLQLCKKAKLVKLGHVALDGTKVLASASKHKDEDDDDSQGPSAVSADLPKHRIPTELDGTPKPKAQRNFTDPDSRIMCQSGAVVQAYNAQTVVDAESQIIVAEAVTNQAPDCEHLVPMLDRVRQNCGADPAVMTADSGFFSTGNADACEGRTDAYIAVGRERQANATGEQTIEPDTAAAHARSRMRDKLCTERGKQIYARRKAIVEPPYGQIKQARGFRRFSLRGLDKVRCEWTLVCLTHNLLKLFRAPATRELALA